MKDAKNRTTKHVNIKIGETTPVLDAPLALNLRIIPRVFTAPFQALGLVVSIFARITHSRITLEIKDDENSST